MGLLSIFSKKKRQTPKDVVNVVSNAAYFIEQYQHRPDAKGRFITPENYSCMNILLPRVFEYIDMFDNTSEQDLDDIEAESVSRIVLAKVIWKLLTVDYRYRWADYKSCYCMYCIYYQLIESWVHLEDMTRKQADDAISELLSYEF